jgi:hypothetical protein
MKKNNKNIWSWFSNIFVRKWTSNLPQDNILFWSILLEKVI